MTDVSAPLIRFVDSEMVLQGDAHQQTEEEKAARIADMETFFARFDDIPALNKKKRRSLIEMSEAKYAAYKQGVVIVDCCRCMNLPKAYQVYLESKAKGIEFHNDVYSMLISLVAGLGDQGSSLAPPRTVDPPSDAAAARSIFADLRKNNVPITESMYTAMIRCYSSNGSEREALDLYKEMTRPFTEQELVSVTIALGEKEIPKKYQRPFLPKLRTFGPLLAGFSSLGDAVTCQWIFNEMTERFKITPMERDYVSMLKVYVCTRDKQNFHTVLRAFMEDHLVPQQSTWAVLRQWFERCETAEGEPYAIDVCEVSSVGCLDANGQFLRSVDLDEYTREALLRQIDTMASQRHDAIVTASAQTGAALPTDNNHGNKSSTNTAAEMGAIVLGGGKGKMTPQMLERTLRNAQDTQAKWNVFKEWVAEILASRVDTFENLRADEQAVRHLAQQPRYSYMYDVIIDGANIGYYKQNYAEAPQHVDFRQIDWMLRHLQRIGYKPLLMLHCRHLHSNAVPADYMPLVKAWRNEKLVFETPSKCNDDWFWLYLAVTLQCKVVTNDEMWDHHFQMLSPRSFARWKERHQIHFSFSTWINAAPALTTEKSSSVQSADDSSSSNVKGAELCNNRSIDGAISAHNVKQRKVVLDIPPCYSRRMQCIFPDASYAFPCQENKQWLCCYRKKIFENNPNTVPDTFLGNKRIVACLGPQEDGYSGNVKTARIEGTCLGNDVIGETIPYKLTRQLSKPVSCLGPEAIIDVQQPLLVRQSTKPADIVGPELTNDERSPPLLARQTTKPMNNTGF